MNHFQEKLGLGRKWEDKVSSWLQANRQYVLDVYEYRPTSDGQFKSPRLKIVPTEESLVLPDLQVASNGATHWIEVKSKDGVGTPFKNNPNCRNPNYRTTGIDLDYWRHYCRVAEVTGLPVLIYFVHYNQGEIRASSLSDLTTGHSKYESPNCGFGKGGMVFWNYDSLSLVARIDENETIHGL